MIYSTPCAYAVRALARLAASGGEGFTKLRVLADEEGIPTAFLAKIFQRLAEAGLLRSAKGPRGGYALARPARKVTLYAIKEAVDGVHDLDACAVGMARCSELTPCPLHDSWKPLREALELYLRSVNLEDMAAAIEKKEGLTARRAAR